MVFLVIWVKEKAYTDSYVNEPLLFSLIAKINNFQNQKYMICFCVDSA